LTLQVIVLVTLSLQRIDDLDDAMEMLKENSANKKKLLKAVREFISYILAGIDPELW
jgi:hypothetical protein